MIVGLLKIYQQIIAKDENIVSFDFSYDEVAALAA